MCMRCSWGRYPREHFPLVHQSSAVNVANRMCFSCAHRLTQFHQDTDGSSIGAIQEIRQDGNDPEDQEIGNEL